MKIGTFARENSQVERAIQFSPDFIDLRMDLNYSLSFQKITMMLSDTDIEITLHLPSSPDWKPQEISREIVPYIDIGAEIGAKLVTIHTTLSPLFYTDEDIDNFLQSVVLAHDAALEVRITLAVENLGLYYSELELLFESCPRMRLALDIGHGQIYSTENRSIAIIQSFYDRIEMVNVHDNHGSRMLEEVISMQKNDTISKETMRELGKKHDEHLPIGEGEIDFKAIFGKLKKRGYDKRFLMMCKDPFKFPDEREKFLNLWDEA